jgi:multisubunit Na+/H+ antiporter MnhC subunit
VIGATTYSSFTQYGALSLGQINLFGANNAPPGYPFANMLSFGNTTNLGYFYSAGRGTPPTGNPLQARCLNDPFAVYAPKASLNSGATSIDLATAGANLNLTASGTIQIGTGTPAKPIPAGKRIVIYAPNASTVEIRNDIAYADGPYGSVDQIPQVVVLTNGNIVVDAGVTRIDGIYAAKGNFTTCDILPQLDTCTTPLQINGMVIAGGTVKPFRTAGATSANYSERAEVFRLRPDAFLNQVGGSTDDIIRTVDQREVPPRF